MEDDEELRYDHDGAVYTLDGFKEYYGYVVTHWPK